MRPIKPSERCLSCSTRKIGSLVARVLAIEWTVHRRLISLWARPRMPKRPSMSEGPAERFVSSLPLLPHHLHPPLTSTPSSPTPSLPLCGSKQLHSFAAFLPSIPCPTEPTTVQPRSFPRSASSVLFNLKGRKKLAHLHIPPAEYVHNVCDV